MARIIAHERARGAMAFRVEPGKPAKRIKQFGPVPILGIVCGFLLSMKDVGTRHTCAITTAQRNVSAGILMCIFPFGRRPLVSAAALSINILGIVILLIVGMEWGRAQAQKGAVADTAVAVESVS